jgi:NADH-quinone oxidoreductase B subunit
MVETKLPSGWDKALNGLKTWARVNSPWAIHFNSGSCNGCDIEILATLTPRYDLERVGVKLQGSPRHADVLICTGPVTRQARDRLVRVYEQMPEPKFVVVVGSCGLSGGVFAGSYNVLGGIDTVIPVNAYVPGCPPRPEAIIYGVVALLNSLKNPSPKPIMVDLPEDANVDDLLGKKK